MRPRAGPGRCRGWAPGRRARRRTPRRRRSSPGWRRRPSITWLLVRTRPVGRDDDARAGPVLEDAVAALHAGLDGHDRGLTRLRALPGCRSCPSRCPTPSRSRSRRRGRRRRQRAGLGGRAVGRGQRRRGRRDDLIVLRGPHCDECHTTPEEGACDAARDHCPPATTATGRGGGSRRRRRGIVPGQGGARCEIPLGALTGRRGEVRHLGGPSCRGWLHWTTGSLRSHRGVRSWDSGRFQAELGTWRERAT